MPAVGDVAGDVRIMRGIIQGHSPLLYCLLVEASRDLGQAGPDNGNPDDAEDRQEHSEDTQGNADLSSHRPPSLHICSIYDRDNNPDRSGWELASQLHAERKRPVTKLLQIQQHSLRSGQ